MLHKTSVDCTRRRTGDLRPRISHSTEGAKEIRGGAAHLWKAMSAKVLLNGCGDALAQMPGIAGRL